MRSESFGDFAKRIQSSARRSRRLERAAMTRWLRLGSRRRVWRALTRRLSLGWDWGGCGAARPLFKEGNRAEQGLLTRIARGGCDSSSCPTRTEVGDGSYGWAPPVGVPGARDPPVSGGNEVERCGCWAAQRGPGAGPRWEKGRRGRKGKQAAGGKEDWAEPKSSEGESLSLFFIFCFSFKNKPISKYFQNQI